MDAECCFKNGGAEGRLMEQMVNWSGMAASLHIVAENRCVPVLGSVKVCVWMFQWL